jgi:peptide/nickel transport system permease protein
LTAFLIRRLLFAIVSSCSRPRRRWLLTRLAPGDLTSQLGPGATQAEIAATRARFALDRGPLAQWLSWAGRAATFDLGNRFSTTGPWRRW